MALVKEGLVYSDKHDEFINKYDDWAIGKPETAFLYPAFNNRSSDVNEALFFTKKADMIHKEIIEEILGSELTRTEEMQKNVDALLVINNERLREIYTDGITTMREAFAKADDILSVATKSIAEMITMEGNINLDFRDVKKILKNGGVAIMSTGIASGERRLKHAIDDALKSPLLNDNDISKAKKILFNISWSKDAPLLIEETNEIDSFMESLDKNIEVIWGEAEDPSLGENVKFTVLATGFGSSSIPGMEQLQHQRSKEEVEAQEEREAQEQERIDRIYGRNTQKKRPHHLPYILTTDDFHVDARNGLHFVDYFLPVAGIT